jgi:uncharacterized protein YjbJ (UPF0337 family)
LNVATGAAGENRSDSNAHKGENSMKSSLRDKVEGKMHWVKGKIKEVIGKAVNNPDLEAKGNKEILSGAMQKKVGAVKRAVGK